MIKEKFLRFIVNSLNKQQIQVLRHVYKKTNNIKKINLVRSKTAIEACKSNKKFTKRQKIIRKIQENFQSIFKAKITKIKINSNIRKHEKLFILENFNKSNNKENSSQILMSKKEM